MGCMKYLNLFILHLFLLLIFTYYETKLFY